MKFQCRYYMCCIADAAALGMHRVYLVYNNNSMSYITLVSGLSFRS